MEVFSVKKLIFITFFIVALSSFSLAQPFSASIPSYPKDAFTEGQEGKVWLYVKITELGLVDSIEILKSSNTDLLDKAAKLHVKSWKYAKRYKPYSLVVSVDYFIDSHEGPKVDLAVYTTSFHDSQLAKSKIVNPLEKVNIGSAQNIAGTIAIEVFVDRTGLVYDIQFPKPVNKTVNSSIAEYFNGYHFKSINKPYKLIIDLIPNDTWIEFHVIDIKYFN